MLYLTGVGVLGAASDTTPLTWQIDAVDTDGPGKFSSMKVDTAGNVHVAYVIDDDNRFPLKYAIWTASAKRWFTMTIAQSVGACSLTLDSKQHPHISYTDYGSMSGSKLRYAHWDGQMWRFEALRLNSDTIAYYNSIALDLKDNPTLSFYEYRGALDTDFRIRLRTVCGMDKAGMFERSIPIKEAASLMLWWPIPRDACISPTPTSVPAQLESATPIGTTRRGTHKSWKACRRTTEMQLAIRRPLRWIRMTIPTSPMSMRRPRG